MTHGSALKFECQNELTMIQFAEGMIYIDVGICDGLAIAWTLSHRRNTVQYDSIYGASKAALNN